MIHYYTRSDTILFLGNHVFCNAVECHSLFQQTVNLAHVHRIDPDLHYDRLGSYSWSSHHFMECR